MQIESKTIYKDTSEKNSLDPELIKSVGDMVFMEMNRLTKNPPNLILDLRGLGKRYVRKRKSENILRCLKVQIADPEDQEDKEKLAQEIIFLEKILERYEVFLTKKREKRIIRYAYQSPVESPVQQEEVQKASEDNNI